ncbi:MAG: aromatic ring-hydroxylating oxygenase subunit alpha [bacterium]
METKFKQIESTASEPFGSASSLPFFSYSDNDVHAAERAEIFHKDWVFVCAENEIGNSGDYFAFTLAGEPVVVVRGKDNHLRALSNVCRHRGTLLNENGFGNSKRFVCPYHAWTYDSEGTLVGVPHPGNVEINKTEHCLPQFLISIWHGLVFVSLNQNVVPLSEKLAGIEPYLKRFRSERFTNAFSGKEEEWASNWKLAMENAMESYHLFKVHSNTLEATTPTKSAFYVEGGADWTITGGKIVGSRSKLWDWFVPSDSKLFENYLLISIPPSFVGVFTYDSWDWISVLPKNVEECWVRSAGLYESRPPEDKRTTEFVEAFFAEDKEICERVQTGMHAIHSQGGKLVELERIVVDFHRFYASHMFNTTPPEVYQSPESGTILGI